MDEISKYIDKLQKLDFKNMYMNDFFLTWEKTDDEIEAVFTVADALRELRKIISPQKYLKAVWGFLFLETTPQEHAFHMLPHVISLVWKCRILMKINRR